VRPRLDVAASTRSLTVAAPCYRAAMRQSLREKSLGSVIGRRNRLPHHDKASNYGTVGRRFRLSNDFSRRLVSMRITTGRKTNGHGDL
jgi:hypothetical protein